MSSDRDEITEDQADKFRAENYIEWIDVEVLLNGYSTIPIEDVTFDQAVYLIRYEAYTAIPF